MSTQETKQTSVLAQMTNPMSQPVEATEKELALAMAKALAENEFYRQINDDMRSGLKGIYQNISRASAEDLGPGTLHSDQTAKLFSTATNQIEEVMQTTLEAAEQIMEDVESLLQQQEQAGEIISGLLEHNKNEPALTQLRVLNTDLGNSLSNIMTALSFQDLTGQRLKKVLHAIASMQEGVFDLYVSTGLMLKSKEETPEKALGEIAAETKQKVTEIKNSELKGPTRDASQADVDSLLASLGL